MWKTKYKIAVLTASDQGFAGTRKDESAPRIIQRMEQIGANVVEYALLADGQELLKQQLFTWSTSGDVDCILTTGGTGLSPRDCMPEATLAIATRLVPGIAETIRAQSMQITSRAMLSRAVSVICEQTLIINLPGSPKAVDETLDILLPVLEHALDILCSNTSNCART